MLHASKTKINENHRGIHGISPGEVRGAFDVIKLPERVTPEIYL